MDDLEHHGGEHPANPAGDRPAAVTPSTGHPHQGNATCRDRWLCFVGYVM